MTGTKLKLNWKYALGEILLIFIGISLAIGFQNWNETRKDNIKINGYLATIAGNVTTDSAEISRFIESSAGKKKSGEAYISAVRKKEPSFEAFIEGLVQLDEEYLNINTHGFEGLKASGFLSNIQGDEIEKALFDYYSYFEEIHEEERSQNEYIEAQELEFVKNAASNELMIMVTDIYTGKRTAELSPQEEKLLSGVFDHPSLISINLRAGFINSSYQALLQKGIHLKTLIDLRLKE